MPAENKMPDFQIIRVKSNGARSDGTPSKNKYTIEVEVPYGVFTAVVPRGTDRLKLSQPLQGHPAAQTLAKELAEAVKLLESEGRISSENRAIVEFATPSPGAADRTKRAVEIIREFNTRRADSKS